MAQTAPATAGRKTLTLPAKKAHQKAGVEDHAARVEDKQREVVFATETDLVNGLSSAFGFHRDALNFELAVSLIYLASQKASPHPGTKVGRAIGEGLRGLYVKAGYDAAKTDGEDYKTVQRRIGYSIGLFQKLGGEETVRDWVGDNRPKVQVKELAEYLDEHFKFSGMSAVAEYIGKSATRETRAPKLGDHKSEEGKPQEGAKAEEQGGAAETSAPVPPKHQISAEAAAIPGHAGTDGVKADAKQEVTNGDTAAAELSEEEKAALAETSEEAKARQEAEAKKGGRRANDNLPPERILISGPLRLAIPFEASFEDVTTLALNLMEFAKKMREEAMAGNSH